MSGSMVDIQSPTAEIRRGKRKKIEITGQKYNGLPYYIGWWRGPAVEHRSLADVLSLSCARLVADG